MRERTTWLKERNYKLTIIGKFLQKTIRNYRGEDRKGYAPEKKQQTRIIRKFA